MARTGIAGALWAIAGWAGAITGGLLLGAVPAFAEESARDRTKGAFTMVGAPYSVQCAAYAAQGLTDLDSVQACDRALEQERLNRANRIATLINRGALHLRRKDGTAALADFDAVIALDKKNAEAHLNRGAALVMTGRPGPAVEAITQALSLGVREPHKAYFNRGAAREAMQSLRGAYEDYETALKIQPDWGPAQAELQRFVRGRRDSLAVQLSQTGEDSVSERQ